MHTAQETFDHIVNNLRKQGCKSVCDIKCVYRGQNGARCAAGWCISDEQYFYGLEGNTVHKGSEVYKAICDSGWNPDVAGCLQDVHDNYWECDWEKGFEEVAEELGLTYTPPE